MGSIWRRLKLVWITLAGVLPFLLLLFYAYPESMTWFDGFLVKAASSWFLFAVVYSFYLLVTFRPAATVHPAAALLSDLTTGTIEYGLLLRPFGSDGYVPLRVWYPPDSARALLLRAVATSKTVEQVLEAAVRRHLGCETFALVDPQLKIVPRSPRYISAANESWRQSVDTLLRRALIVMFILPPGQHAREALRWEMGRAIELGLIGRMIIALPPPSVGSSAGYETLQELGDLFPSLAFVERDAIVVYPHSYEELEWFRAASDSVFDKTYDDVVAPLLSRMNLRLKGLAFSQRYPYFKR